MREGNDRHRGEDKEGQEISTRAYTCCIFYYIKIDIPPRAKEKVMPLYSCS